MRKKAACRFAAFIPQPRASWTVPLLLAGALLGSQPLLAEWPQILGPERNGQVAEPLPTSFPAGGPRALWRYPVGEGMAGVAVAGGKALVFHRPGGVERLEALDAKTGASLWRSDAPASYRGGILPDSGPRAVPTVHGDAALVLGAGGLLRAHSLSDGAERWRVDLADTFAAPEGYFGFGSSPLVLEAGERALVIVPAGGDRSAVVAYDLASGRLAWRAGEDRASYSSPIVATLGGRRQVVASTRMHTVGLEPGSGRELWRVPFGRRGPSVVAAVPVVAGGRLLLTAAYGVGGLLLDFSAAREPQSVWKGDQLSSHYPTPVVLGGHIYGATGREDHGNGQLRALELESGKVLWTEKGYGLAHLLTDGSTLLAQRIDGTLDLIRADPKGFRRLDSAEVAKTTVRAQPALSDGVLYLRTTPGGGDGEVFALRLSP